MPNISSLKESRFLKKEDCGAGILVTVAGCHEENMALEGQPEQKEWCLTFTEPVKPLVLKSTNAQIIASFLGSDETDNWMGRKIVLYHDPSVSMRGKVVGGIRARAPRGAASAANPVPRPQALPPAAEAAMGDEDLPF